MDFLCFWNASQVIYVLEHDTWNTTEMASRSCTVCPEVPVEQDHTTGAVLNIILTITVVVIDNPGLTNVTIRRESF